MTSARQPYQHITHPARCNRRECQARRNLSKHPALYRTWPRCHVCGEGLMYVDWYRMRRGPRDKAPVCTDPNCGFTGSHLDRTGKLIERHRIDTKGCAGYQDHVAERAMIASKHSPIPRDHGGDPGF